MNHQRGRAGQLNRIANTQNEVNPRESNGSVGFVRYSSSSSLINGSDLRFQNRLSGPRIFPHRESATTPTTNDRSAGGVVPRESIPALGLNISSSRRSLITGSVQRVSLSDSLSGSSFHRYHGSGSSSTAPSNDHSVVVLPHHDNIDSAAGHEGNNSRYDNQNPSLVLSLHHNGPQNLSASSSSALTAIHISGVPGGYVVEEQRGDDISGNLRHLPFKRRSPDDHAFSEFAIGESSSTGAQAAGIPKRRAFPSPFNPNNVCNCPLHSHSVYFEDDIGNGAASAVPEVQHHLIESGQTESRSFQTNINLQEAANPQGFVPPRMLSIGYTRDPYDWSSGHQFGHPPNFFGPAETPFEHVPNFHEQALQASPWTNITRPRNAPPSFVPVCTIFGSENLAQFHHGTNNIPDNYMLGPQIGRGNWAPIPANLSISSANANSLGNFPVHSYQFDSSPSVHRSNAATSVPRFNIREQYMHISSEFVSHPVTPSVAFPRQSSPDPSDSDPSEISQGINFPIGFGNSVTENEHRSVARSENQADGNYQPHFTPSSSESSAERRSRLMNEVRNALEHLRNGGSLRIEELMVLDYSLVLNMLERQNNLEDEQPDIENMPYEDLVALGDQIGNVDTGVSEDEIMMYLGHETFQSATEGTSDNVSCCICQEDYVNGDELGRLDCGHKYHVACIKQWLVQKNICPICKQTALTIIDEDEEEDDE